MDMKAERITGISLMICLITLCSWITVPSIVPFTLQTFGVFCAILMLGGRDASIAIALYILLGCIGVPVFAGFQGGIGVIAGPTGGYIVGFFLMAIIYALLGRVAVKGRRLKWMALMLCLLFCYFVGTVWFMAFCKINGSKYSVLATMSICVIPFVIPDLVKLFLAVKLSDRVRKRLR